MSKVVHKASYPAVRSRLNTGDLVFFGGEDFVSDTIKFFTRSSYSHVAIVLRTEQDRVILMESTMMISEDQYKLDPEDRAHYKKFRGVQQTYLSERCAGYKGLVDIAPISEYSRLKFDVDACEKFLLKAEHTPYDTRGALLAGLGQILRIPGKQREDAMFCSELASAALRNGGLWMGDGYNPTPELLAEMPIFQGFYRVKERG